MGEGFVAWVQGLPGAAVYAVLVLLSALENVFPPVPADVAVVLGAFLAREGVMSAPLLGFICWLANTASAAGMYFFARAHAERVEVPLFAECCGFAGDRGFLVPELTASATAAEAAEVRRILDREPGASCYSTCRTCEIGMSRAVGRPFRSLLQLVHEAVARA